jgi:hypothetical protein
LRFDRRRGTRPPYHRVQGRVFQEKDGRRYAHFSNEEAVNTYETKTSKFKISPLLCGVLSLGLLSLQAVPAQKGRGTDILHFSATETMIKADPASEATGKVLLRHNAQGKVIVQNLDIAVQDLAPETEYFVFATLVDSTSVQVGALTTDDQGSAKLRFSKVTHLGNGKSNKPGKGVTALPEILSDLPAVRELSIASQVLPETTPPTYTDVLVADLSQPDKLQYLVKRDVSTDDVRATVQVMVNPSKAQFRMSARNLSPSTSYWVAANTYVTPEFVTTEVTTDTKGRLEVRTAMEPLTEVLNLHEWQLWGTATAPVAPDEPILSTVFPTVPTAP